MATVDSREDLLKQYLKENKHMSDSNIRYFINEFYKLSEQEKSDLIYEMVGKEIYKMNPAGIETFIDDPYFLGDVYEEVFPFWREMIKEIYPAPFCKKYDQVILSCATRCFGKGTKILMYDGSTKNVEDIQVGDKLMGDDSSPRTVLSLARGQEDMYKITPNNGIPFVCNKSHILSLRCTANKERAKCYVKDAITDITVSDYLAKSKTYKHHMKLYKVPVEFQQKESLPTDPYIYGLWLGDGHKRATTLTSIDPEIISIWETYFTERNCSLSYQPHKNPKVKMIRAKIDGNNDLFDVRKRSVESGEKRILKEFLMASRENRLKLLAGIIDTDGSLEKNHYYSITTKSRGLAEDYTFLARSLGFKTSLKIRNQKLAYKNKESYTSYRVSINGFINEIPVVLQRKKNTECKYKVNPLNTGFKIESLGVGDYYGFEVDGNHRFLLEDFTVQHNSGKTVLTSVILDYEIYLLTCMINPTKVFSASNIVIALLSKDNSTAVSQIGAEIYKCLTQAPYFKGVVNDKLSFSKVDKDGVKITDDILVKAGSSISTVIGTNLYAGCIDEANAPSPRIAAENLIDVRMRMYQEMRDRRESSFSKAPKRSGMLLFTSSPTDEGDVLSEIIDNVKKEDIQGVLIRDNIPRWVARDEAMDETFDFFLGSDTKDPCILDGSIELKPDEWERVIQIPAKEDYFAQFNSDPYLAIQNIAGRRTMPETALFNTVAVFEKVFNKENDIFRDDTPTISLTNGLSLEDFLIDKEYFSHPKRPECFRYIHLDMAYRCDRFGLASVYSDRIKYTDEEGHEIFLRKYFVDFCLGVQSKNKETVDILKVLEFVYSLKEKGYPLKLVTTDNHQGEIARQMIAKKGVRTEYLSMEKTKEQYHNLKNIILTERLEGYKNPALMRELRGLRESQKKIQKGKGYTDDMSDALAGALWSCSQDKFYKRNNEAISEIIQQTGQSMGVNRNFTGLANRLNNKNVPFNRRNLGFNYGK